MVFFFYYSKAIDTVRFSTALKKMHRLGFSGSFLKWMLNYPSDRHHFVQIDDRRSDRTTSTVSTSNMRMTLPYTSIRKYPIS